RRFGEAFRPATLLRSVANRIVLSTRTPVVAACVSAEDNNRIALPTTSGRPVSYPLSEGKKHERAPPDAASLSPIESGRWSCPGVDGRRGGRRRPGKERLGDPTPGQDRRARVPAVPGRLAHRLGQG